MKLDKNMMLVGVAAIAVVVIGVLLYAKTGFSMPNLFGPSPKSVGQKAVDYINSSNLSSQPASLESVSSQDGLIKIKIKIGAAEYDSYATADGKLLFPQGFDMSQAKKTTAANQTQNQTASATVTKSAKANLEAFVVSSCPFGLQMQRAIAQAVKAVPSLAQSVTVRYIGSISGGKITSMHDSAPGGGEAQENLRQICIREEQPAKYWPYVSCYMQKATGTLPNGMPLGDSTSCQASTGVDTAKLNACVSDPKRGLADAQKDFDLNTKYGVQGSPTLVLNGTTINESNYGGRSADGVKSMVCAGLTSQSSFCSQKLDTGEASTSFSLAYANTSGTSTANNNCNTQ